MENKLEKLLLTKNFGQLTAEEKYYVTESIGEEEYSRLHVLLKNSRQAMKNTPPAPPHLKGQLMDAFRKEHRLDVTKKPSAIIRLMRHRIPAWQAAAAIALLLAAHFWSKSEPRVVQDVETVYVHKTDTIFKEVAMPAPIPPTPLAPPRIRTNVKPTDGPLPAEPEIVAVVDTSARQYGIGMDQLPDSFSMRVSYPKGQSVTQTADLWKLLGEVY